MSLISTYQRTIFQFFIPLSSKVPNYILIEKDGHRFVFIFSFAVFFLEVIAKKIYCEPKEGMIKKLNNSKREKKPKKAFQ